MSCPQSILAYNGGAVIAMGGKNCVAICSDLRLGIQNQTVAKDFKKVSVFNLTFKLNAVTMSTLCLFRSSGSAIEY